MNKSFKKNEKKNEIKNDEKNKKNEKNEKNEDCAKKNRKQNTLGNSTKMFIEYIVKSNAKTFDLRSIVKELKIKQRRIYDITDVLKGKYVYNLNYRSWIYQRAKKK